MPPMKAAEWKTFVTQGTRTGKLATVREDGRPHVMPVWFVLDGGELVFMTGAGTVKGRNLLRTGQASLCVDDDRPPFSFVAITGTVTTSTDLGAMLAWSVRIADRYMGSARAEELGRRNAVEGELLVRLTPTTVVAQSAVAD